MRTLENVILCCVLQVYINIYVGYFQVPLKHNRVLLSHIFYLIETPSTFLETNTLGL